MPDSGGGAANIQGVLHVPRYMGSALDEYPRRRKKPRDESVGKAAPRTLYVNRPVINGEDIVAWAKAQGFPTALLPDDLHVTIAYSKEPFDWSGFQPQTDTIHVPAVSGSSGERHVVRLGQGDVVALQFESPQLGARWREFCDAGASWSFPSFKSHVSISWDPPDGIEATASPYLGPIILGPEEFAEVNSDWAKDRIEKTWGATAREAALAARRARTKGETKDYDWESGKLSGRTQSEAEDEEMQKRGARHSKSDMDMIQNVHDHAVSLGAVCSHDVAKSADTEPGEARIVKVDQSLGLVFGYAIVCKVNGEPYYDLNIDFPSGERVPEHIPEDAMLKASMEFMETADRPGNEMHAGPETGTYVFAFPLTTDIAKSLGISAEKTGLLVAYKPPPEVFAKFVSGEYRGFSIEGSRTKYVEHE